MDEPAERHAPTPEGSARLRLRSWLHKQPGPLDPAAIRAEAIARFGDDLDEELIDREIRAFFAEGRDKR